MEIKNILFVGIIISLVLAGSFILSDINKLIEEEAIIGFGITADTLITIATSILAVILFVISAIAYKKDKRKRLLFVTGAFFLFAVKGFLIVTDEFFPRTGWPEPVAHLLDFGILILFFSGLAKK
ncbi:Uncharacterised protein [uncultured archaeon]|nr:Uncharacterised protein [uncultured archaeon]